MNLKMLSVFLNRTLIDSISRKINYVLAFGGQRCYTCEVWSETMGQCIKKQVIKDCGRHDDYCHTTSYKTFEKWVFHKKGCVPKDQCLSQKLCATLEDKTKCLVSYFDLRG